MDQFQHAMFIEPDLKQDQLTAKDLEKATSLKLFMKAHCHETHYMFQVKKCADSACYYCGQHPVRLPQDIFYRITISFIAQ